MSSPRTRKKAAEFLKETKSIEAPKEEPLARIGFVRSASDVYKGLPKRVQVQLMRKLKELALNPAIGKPLVDELKGCRRVSFGRLRCVTRVAEGVAVVLVLVIAPRRSDSKEDPYQTATEMMRNGGDEVQTLLQTHIKAFLADSSGRSRVEAAVSKVAALKKGE